MKSIPGTPQSTGQRKKARTSYVIAYLFLTAVMLVSAYFIGLGYIYAFNSTPYAGTVVTRKDAGVHHGRYAETRYYDYTIMSDGGQILSVTKTDALYNENQRVTVYVPEDPSQAHFSYGWSALFSADRGRSGYGYTFIAVGFFAVSLLLWIVSTVGFLLQRRTKAQSNP